MSDDSFHIRAADQAAFAHEKGVHAQTMNQQMALRDFSRSATLFSEAFIFPIAEWAIKENNPDNSISYSELCASP